MGQNETGDQWTASSPAIRLVALGTPPAPPVALDRETVPLRASHPSLVAASRAIAEHRDTIIDQWIDWLGDGHIGSRTTPRQLIEAEFGLILDAYSAMVGPLRREVKTVYNRVAELYGRHAAGRGLAAGEVVEEMQHLRELLIRHLAPTIAGFRPRQSMALFLRLNRLVDHGVAMAVVGYTDELVASLLPNDDSPAPMPNVGDTKVMQERLQSLRDELTRSIAVPAR